MLAPKDFAPCSAEAKAAAGLPVGFLIAVEYGVSTRSRSQKASIRFRGRPEPGCNIGNSMLFPACMRASPKDSVQGGLYCSSAGSFWASLLSQTSQRHDLRRKMLRGDVTRRHRKTRSMRHDARNNMKVRRQDATTRHDSDMIMKNRKGHNMARRHNRNHDHTNRRTHTHTNTHIHTQPKNAEQKPTTRDRKTLDANVQCR